MKKTIIGLVAGLAVMSFGAAAQAELLTVAADLPLTYTFDNPAAGDEASGVTGSKLSINFIAFPVGIAIENYTVTMKSGKEANISLYDLFWTAPVPILNIVIGLGFGGAGYDATTKTTVSDATMTQYFASVGMAIFPLVDIHLGYHVVQGTGTGTTSDLVLDGTMLSLGVKVGF